MSAIEIQALESNFNNWKTERAPDLDYASAFERYAADFLLKDDDLADEDISSGYLEEVAMGVSMGCIFLPIDSCC